MVKTRAAALIIPTRPSKLMTTAPLVALPLVLAAGAETVAELEETSAEELETT